MSRPVSRAPDRLSQEITVLRQLRAASTPRERQRLQGELLTVGQWMPQIRALARRWQCDGVDAEDFEQAGLMGLLEAASRYDGRAEGWPTYATAWIRRRIAELARAQGGPIVPETQWEQRTARRQRVNRRPAEWRVLETQFDYGNWDLAKGTGPGNCAYGAITLAIQEMQAAEEDQAAREAQRQRIRGALERLPRWVRCSLADLTGERIAQPRMLEETRAIFRKHALRRLREELEG